MNLGLVGRNELPNNLKYLFRFISFMRPIEDKIAEILFLSDGIYLLLFIMLFYFKCILFKRLVSLLFIIIQSIFVRF